MSSDRVRCVAFKPDDPNMLVSGSLDKNIKMWDITSGSCLSTLRGHSDWVRGVAFNPRDPQMLVSCSVDKTIKVWNITSGACLSTLTGHTSAVGGFGFSADGQWLIAGFQDGMLRLLDAHPKGGTVVSEV